MEREKFDKIVKEFVTAAHKAFLDQGVNIIVKHAEPEEINRIISGGVSFGQYPGCKPQKRPAFSGDEELNLAEVFTHIAQRIDGGEMLKDPLPTEARCAAFSKQALERNASEFAMLRITPKQRKL